MTDTLVLPASLVTVPASAARWTVKSQRSLNTSDGVAFVARVALDGKEVGTIENSGTGGGTWFRPASREAREAFDLLAKDCADLGLAVIDLTKGLLGDIPVVDAATGETVTLSAVDPHEWIADALAAEHDLNKRFTAAAKRGRAAVLTEDNPNPTEGYATVNVTAEALLADRAFLTKSKVVKVWSDGRWVSV